MPRGDQRRPASGSVDRVSVMLVEPLEQGEVHRSSISRYVVEAVGTGSRYRSEFRLEPDADDTRLVMTFGAEPLGMVARVMAATIGRLFEGATRKALAADLADIARASESAA